MKQCNVFLRCGCLIERNSYYFFFKRRGRAWAQGTSQRVVSASLRTIIVFRYSRARTWVHVFASCSYTLRQTHVSDTVVHAWTLRQRHGVPPAFLEFDQLRHISPPPPRTAGCLAGSTTATARVATTGTATRARHAAASL